MATITKITNPTNPWRVQIRRAGQSTISQCFPTNVEAKRWAREEETKLDKNPAANAGGKLTVAELVIVFTKNFVDKPEGTAHSHESGKSIRSPLRFITKHLGRFRVDELTTSIFKAVFTLPRAAGKNNRSPTNKPYAGKTRLDKMKALKMVLRHGGVLAKAKAPCASAIVELETVVLQLRRDKLLRVNQRDRRPTIPELEMLEAYFANLPPSNTPRVPMWDLILFAMSTCMRRGEIIKIVWEDFDPIDRTIWIMDRKDPTGAHNRHDECPLLKGTFEWHGVPVDPIEIMNRQPGSDARKGRVFPYNAHHLSELFKRACDARGIEDLHFHDLRHEGVSLLFEDGRQIPEVSVVSGHRSWTDLKRYTNLKPKNLHRDTVTS